MTHACSPVPQFITSGSESERLENVERPFAFTTERFGTGHEAPFRVIAADGGIPVPCRVGAAMDAIRELRASTSSPGPARSALRLFLTWAPWIVGLGFAAWWGVNGFLAGLPVLGGMVVFWASVLVVSRDVIAAGTTRASRIPADLLLLGVSFVLGWEGGFALLPAGIAFLIADAIDPRTPRYPIGGSLHGRGLLVLAAGVVALVVSVVLAGGLYSSASSVAVPLPGSPATGS